MKHLSWREVARRNPTLSAWPFVAVILMQMTVGGFSVYLLSATRTLVAGESLWSKGQHEAIYFLNLYIDTGNRQNLASFKKAIGVPLAYEKGRDALEQKPSEPGVARRAFAAGGSAAEDIPSGIWMIERFNGFPFLEEAFARWKETDHLVLELARLGDTIGTQQPGFDPVALRARLEEIDRAITPRANAFARALVDAARVVERLLLIANFTMAGLLAAVTIWRVSKVLRQRRQSEEALEYLASHDELTGIANRRAFLQRLSEAINKGDRAVAFGLLYIDLDQFKIVNDTCGHAAGDALLRRICSPLCMLLDADDLLARLGGDEFSILMPGIDLAGVTAMAESVRATVERVDFIWAGRRFNVTASIGLVHSGSGAVSPEDVMTKADMACFMAKEKGRNRVHSHRDEDQELLGRMSEMNWVQRIQEALSDNRFCLYAQEIVPLAGANDEGLHLEVLIRMRDEAEDLVPPSSFIPAAERFGLMKSIDRWVVSRAFHVLAERRSLKDKRPVTCCAINLSGSTIGDDAFLDFLKKSFADYRIAPRTICFEVTETTAIVNLDAARAFVHDLRALGCSFALDDFGSGMSSFNYLKELPVDYLKIDGAFVKNMLFDRPDRAMVEMISHVGHIMGKKIVAEFVETEALAEVLRDIGVDYGQGFGIAAPVPFDAHFEGIKGAFQRSPERLSA